MLIYHSTTRDIWDKFRYSNSFEPESLKKEGFIHCSTKNQLLQTLNRKFYNLENVIVIEIETGKVKSGIKFEDLKQTGEKHPHIYGSVPVAAIERVLSVRKNKNGLLVVDFFD